MERLDHDESFGLSRSHSIGVCIKQQLAPLPIVALRTTRANHCVPYHCLLEKVMVC